MASRPGTVRKRSLNSVRTDLLQDLQVNSTAPSARIGLITCMAPSAPRVPWPCAQQDKGRICEKHTHFSHHGYGVGASVNESDAFRFDVLQSLIIFFFF